MLSTEAIPHDDETLDPNSLETSAGRLICSVKPTWASKRLTFKRLTTADSSIRYLACLKDTEEEHLGVVVSLYPANSDIYTDHQEQRRIVTLLIQHELAPRLFLTFTNGYLSTNALGKALDLKDQQTHQRIARKMAEFHSVPFEVHTPSLAQKLTYFIDLFTGKVSTLHDRLEQMWQSAEASQYNSTSLFGSFKSVLGLNTNATLPLSFDRLELQLRDVSWTELSADIDHIRLIFDQNWSSSQIPIVLCLNNMKLNNFLFDSANQLISMIDFDHCSSNYFLVDIVSYFLELAKDDYETKYPARSVQKSFLAEYLKHCKSNVSSIIYDAQQPNDHELEYLCDLCGLLIAPVHLYWALWAFLQALLTTPTSIIDYVNYGRVRLAQYQRHKKTFLLSFKHSPKRTPKF